MKDGAKRIEEIEDWYSRRELDPRTGCLKHHQLSHSANAIVGRFSKYQREMDARTRGFDKLEKLADGEVISPKPDLPNISSGETAGLVRRMARNLVQNTPNVEILSLHDDDSVGGIVLNHMLKTKIIGVDEYSNDMQQNLFASTKSALALGFDAVIPVLQKHADGSWYMKYDSIHYRDVYPEPGAKDVREAQDVFVRRYLTKGEVVALIEKEPAGWDVAALKLLCESDPGNRKHESTSHQEKKRGVVPEGYEIITWYSSCGAHFLTFSARNKTLLRIEKNLHPLSQHPVFFLVLEKDDQQPLGKSQVELIAGRQDFQDLMLNGAMKLWYRNINPSIIGYGGVNTIPNLSPGKYTQVSNPNARIEPFEVNTQTLLQYSSISQQNLGSMVNLVGSADQQMATQAGNGMSATPQGVEAQQELVDITTNNYQKSIEAFFSHYCSYALTVYMAELRSVKTMTATADTRRRLLKAGLDAEAIDSDGKMSVDFSRMQGPHYVRCVPGSLVEMEDEKQLRILNQMFVPLSQAIPAMAAVQNQEMLTQAALAIQYIVGRQIELSGASDAPQLLQLWEKGDVAGVQKADEKFQAIEEQLVASRTDLDAEMSLTSSALAQMQEQIRLLTQNQQALLEGLGVVNPASTEQQNSSEEGSLQGSPAEPTVAPANA